MPLEGSQEEQDARVLLYTRLLEAGTRTVQGEDGWADGLMGWSAGAMELHPEQLKICVADPGAHDRAGSSEILSILTCARPARPTHIPMLLRSPAQPSV